MLLCRPLWCRLIHQSPSVPDPLSNLTRRNDRWWSHLHSPCWYQPIPGNHLVRIGKGYADIKAIFISLVHLELCHQNLIQ